jgi:hypothetical protein
VHEAAEYASAVAANQSGIPQAQVAISLARVEAGSLELAAPVLVRHGHGFVDRLRASPYLSRFPASLDPSPFPRTRRYAEPAAKAAERLPDWWREIDAPLVYLTLGSVLGALPDASRRYRAALDAVAELDARVLFAIGHAIEIDMLAAPPPHVQTEAWVSQEQVLPATDVVLAHGGSGTTFGALAFGVPLVLVPFLRRPAGQQCAGRRDGCSGRCRSRGSRSRDYRGWTRRVFVPRSRPCSAMAPIDAPRAALPRRWARPPRSTRSSTH